MDIIDKKLLNSLQTGLPLTENPFSELAKELGIKAQEVIERTQRLKNQRVIRQISSIFDTKKLGYQTALIGMKIPLEFLDKAGEIISRHPGVSHNYARDHLYNLWFTIALPKKSSMKKTVQRLGERVKAEDILLLPAIRLFKIGLKLNMTLGKNHNISCEPSGREKPDKEANKEEINFSPSEIQLIRELQNDFPVVERPFATLAERLGMDEKDVIMMTEDFKKRGIMRRLAAVLYHREVGFTSNIMVAWKVPPEKVVEAGQKMASFQAVSHCYQRSVYPHWPYSMYTMIHGRSKEECKEIVRLISREAGVEEYEILTSVKEYKKMRLKYFTDELDRWEEKNILS